MGALREQQKDNVYRCSFSDFILFNSIQLYLYSVCYNRDCFIETQSLTPKEATVAGKLEETMSRADGKWRKRRGDEEGGENKKDIYFLTNVFISVRKPSYMGKNELSDNNSFWRAFI